MDIGPNSFVNRLASHPHKMLSCPYNMAHQVEQYRMHLHLEKCRKQYPNASKTPCPFRKSHVVNDAEMEYHIETCEDRYTLDKEMYSVENMIDEYRLLATTPRVRVRTEDWEDSHCLSYQPEARKANHIIRKVKGATPSERRKARMEGVKAYQAPGST